MRQSLPDPSRPIDFHIWQAERTAQRAIATRAAVGPVAINSKTRATLLDRLFSCHGPRGIVA